MRPRTAHLIPFSTLCVFALLAGTVSGQATLPSGVTTIQIKHAKVTDVAAGVCIIFPELRCSADARTNLLVIRGPMTIVPKAKAVAIELDGAKALPAEPKPNADDIRVFPIKNVESASAILSAVTTLMQAVQPPAAASGEKKTDATPAPAAVLSPNQDALIVRGDPHILDLIGSKVLGTLQKSNASLLQFASYDVRYAVPNPTFQPGTLVATSTIADLANSVTAALAQTGSADVRVSADPSYPRILVAGSPIGVRRALQLLGSLDRKPALVDLQAQVYEIDYNKATDLGIQLPTGSIQTTVGEYFPPTVAGTTTTAPTPSPVFSLGKITKSPLSVIAQLNFLIQNGSALLVATPHVATVNGRLTSISLTNTIPFVAATVNQSGVIAPTIKDYQTGTQLEIVPLINIDGSISAYVHPKYTTLTGLTQQQAPLTAAREMVSTFRLQSGQAAYISGLEETNEATAQQRIPLISKIPVVGGLFRNKGYQYQHTTLFIVLTATVIDPGDYPTGTLEIAPGRPPLPRPRPIQKAYPVAPPIAEPPVPTLPPNATVAPTDSPTLSPRRR